MSIYVTSDLHFFHRRIIEYCPDSRNFSSVEEMNETIINNWNSIITPDDSTYILGDISFGNAENTLDVFDRLNGKIYLVKGNHDFSKKLRQNNLCDRFEWIKPYFELIHDNKTIVMFHYPIKQWNRKHRGSYNLHGHLHSKNPERLEHRRYDVGIDGSPNFAPYNLEELLIDIDTRLISEPTVDHHGREL